MVSEFTDKFNRDDGQVGSDWTLACGHASIFDEALRPIDSTGSVAPTSPISPVSGLTDEKTQLFFTTDELDAPHQLIRAIWGHDPLPSSVGITGDPSFTILARASKDPMLIDLAGTEEPFCYDQGYGLRVTCPIDGAGPILKIIKLRPNRRVGSADDSDRVEILKQVTLRAQDLNLDPDSFTITEDNKNQTTALPYRGFWQDMALRVRGTDGSVIIEAFLNDRYQSVPILSFTDHQDPLWSIVGDPGVEFISPTLDSQPAGASPFDQVAKSVMACTFFRAETVTYLEQPRSVTPQNYWTYGRLVDRVILLVEKNGDAKYVRTDPNNNTRLQTYLDFVVEAEASIIREEGYWNWLYTQSNLYLQDGVAEYDLSEDYGEGLQIRPGNWQGSPLNYMEPTFYQRRLGQITQTSGRPAMYSDAPNQVNNRRRITLFPVPNLESIDSTDDSDVFLITEYYRRRVMPDIETMDERLPVVPQEDIDVLIYGAAAHGLLLDTDPNAAQAMAQVYQNKLRSLRRRNNRNNGNEQTIMRSAGDVFFPSTTSRIPLLRATQLEVLLI